MGFNPLDRIFLRRKLSDIVQLAIRPRYLHAPNATLLHWRYLSAHILHEDKYHPFGASGQVLRIQRKVAFEEFLNGFAKGYSASSARAFLPPPHPNVNRRAKLATI